MPGKYSAVIGSLPRLAGVSEWQTQVEMEKAKVLAAGTTPTELAAEYTVLRAKKEELETKIKELNVKIETFSQLITMLFEEAGISSLKLMSGDSVSVQLEPYAVVKDRDALRQWAVANGLERSLTLPWQTTNALAKERLLAGEPEPDGVEIFSKSKIVLR